MIFADVVLKAISCAISTVLRNLSSESITSLFQTTVRRYGNNNFSIGCWLSFLCSFFLSVFSLPFLKFVYLTIHSLSRQWFHSLLISTYLRINARCFSLRRAEKRNDSRHGRKYRSAQAFENREMIAIVRGRKLCFEARSKGGPPPVHPAK